MDWTKVIVALIAAAASVGAALIGRSKERKRSKGSARPGLVFASVLSTLLAVAAFLISVFWHQGPKGDQGEQGIQGDPGQIAILEQDSEKLPRGNLTFRRRIQPKQPGVLLVTARASVDIPDERRNKQKGVMSVWLKVTTKVDDRIVAANEEFNKPQEDILVSTTATSATLIPAGLHTLEVTVGDAKTSKLDPDTDLYVTFMILGTSETLRR